MFLKNKKKKESLFNKNNILYILLIIALFFLFFNPNGIMSLMKNQRIAIKQDNEIKKLNKKIKILEEQIAIVSDSLINKEKLNNILKEKGIVEPGEFWYKIEDKKSLTK